MIKLFLFNNVRREEVGQMPLQEILSSEDVSAALIRKFGEFGCVVEPGRGSLYVMREQGMIPFDGKLLLADNDAVVYVDIVKLDNAHEFKPSGKRKGKIIYYLWSDEKKHFNEPHIHARIGNLNDIGCEQIRISFRNYKTKNKLEVDGSFKSPADQKEAIKFVKKHISEIQEFWNSIIHTDQGGPKWED